MWLSHSFGLLPRALRRRNEAEGKSGRLSRIGGQMIEQEASLEVTKHESGETEPDSECGAAEKGGTADMILERDCVDIAEPLSKSCLSGHIQSIKFLYELAELSEKLGADAGAKKFRSLASQWALEPPWTGDASEEDAAWEARHPDTEG